MSPSPKTFTKYQAKATLIPSTPINVAIKVQTVSPAPLNPPAIISCDDWNGWIIATNLKMFADWSTTSWLLV